ncbi:hypothetical protein HYV85_02035 [Candidatus Woesearchaeota archaeon]|nr:hypothetical protein [Candidatus Woesearchaeota archaeon]
MVQKSGHLTRIDDKYAFIGITPSHRGIPIDLATIALAGVEFRGQIILLADSFLHLNKQPEEQIIAGTSQTRRAFEVLAKIYGLKTAFLYTSLLMVGELYKGIIGELRETAQKVCSPEEVIQLVPPAYRHSEQAAQYPLHEAACTKILSEFLFIDIKLGPSTEKPYDTLMQKLNVRILFNYLVDAYAVGTNQPDAVNHYTPTNVGPHGGTRVLLNEPVETSSEKLLSGSEQASRYLLTVASVAGLRLGKEALTSKEIEELHGKKLRKVTQHLVLENIVKPYKAMENAG